MLRPRNKNPWWWRAHRFVTADNILKRVAIFGGTFDPIHHGHLILAREAIEGLRLDRLIFVPSGQPRRTNSKEAGSAGRCPPGNAARRD